MNEEQKKFFGIDKFLTLKDQKFQQSHTSTIQREYKQSMRIQMKSILSLLKNLKKKQVAL